MVIKKLIWGYVYITWKGSPCIYIVAECIPLDLFDKSIVKCNKNIKTQKNTDDSKGKYILETLLNQTYLQTSHSLHWDQHGL